MHYLFDFDGTLVDSMPTFVSVMLRILDENHVEYGDDIVRIITPLGYINTAKYYVTLGVPLPEEQIIEKMNTYAEAEYAHRVEAKAHVIDTLRALKARGDDLNVLTASPHLMLDPCLKRLGIYDLFTNVWSCNDFATSKSDPAIYRMAAEKMGVAVEDVVFLDDNLNADKTAKEAGMRVIGVFDESSRGDEAAIRAIADGYIRDFSELPALSSIFSKGIFYVSNR